MLSRIWVKENKRNRNLMTVAKVNDKMLKNWQTGKKEQTCIPLSR